MEQCMYCLYRIFFKPLSDEGFTCCWAHDEKVEDIDISKGVSPAIERHGLNNIPCNKFIGGTGLFSLSLKKDGERFLQESFKMEG